jgi:predicted transcriptional regulator
VVNVSELSQKEVELLQVFLDKNLCTQDMFYKKGHAWSTINDTLESLINKKLVKKYESGYDKITYELTEDGKKILDNFTVLVKERLEITPPSKINENADKVKISKMGRGEVVIKTLGENKVLSVVPLGKQPVEFYDKYFREFSVSVEFVSGHPAVEVNYISNSTGTICAITRRYKYINPPLV